ncbi:unnamed protein product [Blumeria hordei]|uniref:Uncharacterized protein n=1 Tax=Blumeria hordei TaxID=2867405 RepID=A0A383V189_BLUHO|nr:unnamed protein product [Blumeria hordei]
MEDTYDGRIVMYGNSDPNDSTFYKLNSLSKKTEESVNNVFISYYLIFDQSSRVTGIVKRTFETLIGGTWINTPLETFWMCEIHA